MATPDLQPQENDVNTSSPKATSANNIFKNRKVFNDPIHGQIEIHPVCIRIIDTPQFQRLRHIKQLDTCYLVYPGACHNRFEHSLGVCHLAGKLLKTIRERQPDEDITDRDILCVEIAGLCHDLGQGPFSHVFEKKLIPRLRLEKKFTHEGAAREMFRYMLDNKNGEVKREIQKILADCQIPDFKEFKDKDFTFIEEMIGVPETIEKEKWPYKGREKSKSFMYEIVANKRNGIDVDKWDYIARDSFMLGMKVNFDHNRCFANARVIEVKNGVNGGNGNNGTTGHGNFPPKQICYREKDAQDLYDMFYTRMTLHRRAYQHKTHNLIGMMICDALAAANETFSIADKKISEIVETNDMAAYTQLNDNVIQLIEHTDLKNKPGLELAKDILQDILNRRLYKCVGQTQVEKGKLKDEEDFKKQFNDIVTEDEHPVEENYIGYDIVNLDYGMEDKNPMDKVRFFQKDNINEADKLARNQVSYILPDTFAERIVRVYCKVTGPDPEHRVKRVRKAFIRWCERYHHPLPKGAKPQQTHGRAEQSTASPELSSGDDLVNKHLAEPVNITTDPETTEQQPGSYHAGGVDMRPEQPAASDDMHH